ncbi:hypothetical protein DRN98_03980 [Methanosarcinales archaeon]|nr:MAG: hypothetical protein DRN98_03980 [Methanosarcinales archaeon]
MVTINDSSIRSNIYESVYDLINNDKSGYGSSSEPSLYGGHPDWDSCSFPNIIINPIEVDESDYTIDTNRSVSNKTVVVVIEIFTKKNKDLDIIADGVGGSLKTNIPGLFIVNTSEDNGVVFPNEMKIKMKTMTFTFMRR